MGHLCWVYHDTEEPRIVDSDECEALLADGWRDTPGRDNLPTDEMQALREQFSKLGGKPDGRWNKARLEKEIDMLLDELDKADGS